MRSCPAPGTHGAAAGSHQTTSAAGSQDPAALLTPARFAAEVGQQSPLLLAQVERWGEKTGEKTTTKSGSRDKTDQSGGRDNIGKVLETYHDMSRKFYTHGSPTLFNAGTIRPALSSCFLLTV